MKVGVISVDSDIGAEVASLHATRGDQVWSTSRNGKGSFMELSQPQSWIVPDCERLYFNIGINESRSSRYEVMHINAFSAVDYLAYAAQRLQPNSLIVAYSSEWGSIERTNGSQGLHYKMSKAALNMGVKCLSFSYPQHRWLLLHPGLVQTKILKGKWAVPPISAKQSAEMSVETIDEWEGRFGFLSYDGSKVPW